MPIEFELMEQQQQVKRMVRQFAEAEITPRVMEWEETQQFPKHLFPKMRALGLMGAIVPEEYRGAGTEFALRSKPVPIVRRATSDCASEADPRQTFYSGADKARERTHDARLYRAYLEAAERLHAREAHILRVELDRELKREYQQFLHERSRGDRDSDGRPDRTHEENPGMGQRT